MYFCNNSIHGMHRGLTCVTSAIVAAKHLWQRKEGMNFYRFVLGECGLIQNCCLGKSKPEGAGETYGSFLSVSR